MKELTLTDQALSGTLGGASHPVALRNPDGKIIGWFTPARQFLRDFPIPSGDEDPNVPKVYTSEEVLAKVRAWNRLL